MERNRDSRIQQRWDDGLPLQAVSEQRVRVGSEVTLMVADLQVTRLQLVDEGVGPLVVSAAVANEDMVTIPQCGRNINRGGQWDSRL